MLQLKTVGSRPSVRTNQEPCNIYIYISYRVFYGWRVHKYIPILLVSIIDIDVYLKQKLNGGKGESIK